MAEERLQKILAQAGIASRRKAEQLIVEGRVTVNGEVLKELGSKADPETDHIKVDGTLIHLPKRHVYIALNKPREVVTTVSDPQGRKTVMHLLKGVKERVFPVGRLDYHSEGLLLLTTDGEFANRITSPAGHVEKVYVVKANGQLSEEQLAAFEAGIPLSGRRTAPAKIKLIRRAENPWYEVRLMEGRQNQIRIMFTHFHRLVEKLRRVKIGFLTLGGLPPGMWRYLDAEEVEHFQKLISRSEAEAQRRSKRPAATVGGDPVEITRTEYPVLPKERFRRPRFVEPEAREMHAELRGGDRPVTRRPVAPTRPTTDRPVVPEPRPEPKVVRPAPEGPKSDRPSFQRSSSDRPAGKRPNSRPFDGPKSDRPSFQRSSSDRPAGRRPSSRPFDGPKSDRPSFQRSSSDRPAGKRPSSRPFDGPKSDRPSFQRPPSDRPAGKRPSSRPFDGPKSDRPSFQRPSSDRPAGKRPSSRPFDGPKSDRPSFQRSSSDRPAGKRPNSRPFDGPKSDRPSFQRPPSDRPAGKRPSSRPFDGPKSDRPSFQRPPSDRPASKRPSSRPFDGPKSARPDSRKPPSRKPGPRRRDDH